MVTTVVREERDTPHPTLNNNLSSKHLSSTTEVREERDTPHPTLNINLSIKQSLRTLSTLLSEEKEERAQVTTEATMPPTTAVAITTEEVREERDTPHPTLNINLSIKQSLRTLSTL